MLRRELLRRIEKTTARVDGNVDVELGRSRATPRSSDPCRSPLPDVGSAGDHDRASPVKTALE